MHKEISNIEKFLFKVKHETRGDKAPPIVIRSEEGIHEEQLAIYKDRAKEDENKPTI